MKICCHCKQNKDESEFYKRSSKENPGRKEKLQPTCKLCMKEIKDRCRAIDPQYRKRECEKASKYRKAHPEIMQKHDRRCNLKRSFGITEDEYNKIFTEQNGVCAICGNPENAVLNGKVKKLSIDHCHENNKIRGLLCGRCNTAIGLMKENIDIASKAVYYLLS